MKKNIVSIILLAVFLSGCVGVHEKKESSTKKETLVFVHGAHLTSDSWSSTSKILENSGFSTISVDLPGRASSDNPSEITLDVSSKALCDSIQNVHSPIVLIAHSQGGAVSNNALSICPKNNIKGIIYIAAVAPVDGDKPYSLLSKEDEDNYFKGVYYDNNSGWMMINNKKLFVSVFTNSESIALKNKIMDQAVNEPAVIGDGIVSYDGQYFSKLKKFYIYTKFDKIISIDSQKIIADKIQLEKSVVLDTGHLPMFSSPELLAEKIKGFLH